MTFIKKTFSEISNEVEKTIYALEHETYNSDLPSDNLMKFDGRFIQNMLKLNVHPAFYNMPLIDELDKENDERKTNLQTKMSDNLSKKYLARLSGKDSSM